MYRIPPEDRGRTGRGVALLCFAVVFCLAAAPPASAGDKFAAEFLKIGVGARALGMGGAFASIADDASAAYWNPAGLVQLRNREAMAMHASQFGGVESHNFGSVILPLESASGRSAIGITAIHLSIDDIRVTTGLKLDDNGDPIYDEGNITTKSAYDLALMLSYARDLGDRWSAGVNVKLIRQSLVDAGSSFGIGADLGFLFRPRPSMSIGLKISDVSTTQLYWDSGRRETVSPTITLGAHTTSFLRALRGSITLGVDAAFAFDGLQNADQFDSGSLSGNLLPGMEYWFRDTVALRLGSDAGSLTAGAGVRYRQFGVDYAFLDHEELDTTHRVSALYRF